MHMKLISRTLLAVAVAAIGWLPAESHAQRGEGFSINSIDPEVINAPRISFQGGPRTSRSPDDQWFQVEVDFRVDGDEPVDELTVRYYIYINGQLLRGEVTHVNIWPSRNVFSVVYIPPQSLKIITEGRRLTGAMIEDVGVEIVRRGQVLAEGSRHGRGAWWNQLEQISGFVLNKNQTPFMPLYWDRYPMIKPD